MGPIPARHLPTMHATGCAIPIMTGWRSIPHQTTLRSRLGEAIIRTGRTTLLPTTPPLCPRLVTNRVHALAQAFGAILETFVFAEVCKLAAWMNDDSSLPTTVTRIKMTWTSSVKTQPATLQEWRSRPLPPCKQLIRGSRKLAAASGARFRCGVVLHDADAVLPFGDRLYAVPIASPWAPCDR